MLSPYTFPYKLDDLMNQATKSATGHCMWDPHQMNCTLCKHHRYCHKSQWLSVNTKLEYRSLVCEELCLNGEQLFTNLEKQFVRKRHSLNLQPEVIQSLSFEQQKLHF